MKYSSGLRSTPNTTWEPTASLPCHCSRESEQPQCWGAFEGHSLWVVSLNLLTLRNRILTTIVRSFSLISGISPWRSHFKGNFMKMTKEDVKFGIESGGGKMQIHWMTISGSFCPVALGATIRNMTWTTLVFMAEEWWLELCSLLLRILEFFNAGASHVPSQWQHRHTLINQTINMRTYYDFDVGRSRSMIWYQSVRNLKINHFWRIWL